MIPFEGKILRRYDTCFQKHKQLYQSPQRQKVEKGGIIKK